MLLEAFSDVVTDRRVSDIVISDDCSDEKIYDEVIHATRHIKKIVHYRNKENVGMSRNKMMSVSKAKNEFCIVFDSDNKINSQYLAVIYSIKDWSPKTIYMPDFARPRFDYREFAGLTIDKSNIKKYIDHPLFDCLLNTCNYFVNKKRYLSTYEYNSQMKASDTVYFNYLWLKSGGKFYIVPELQYYHRIHEKSGFLEDAQYNMAMAAQIKNTIKAL